MQRPARFERQGTMTREKRGLENGGGGGERDEFQPEPKRPKVPALASVIVEALKVDSLQKICSSLEPILRRVVSEEVERALAKLGPAKLGARSSPKQIEGPDGRNLQLHFKTKLSLPLFTGGKVEGEQGAAIHVVLLDTNSGRIVTSEPESSAKLDVLVLEGDFNNEDDEDWTEEEFESHVVKEREGKRPLLTGDLQISLKEGIGSLGELTFTDNSSWIRSRKFRLGLKVAADSSIGIRIREAKTEAFTVKDHRGELYKKHYPPSLTDEVWRLEKIGKDGSFHKKLNKCGIFTVEDFLRLVVTDPQRLRNILGSGMSNRMWESLVEHAKTCVLSGKHYIYYADETRNVGAIFNNIYEFSGLIFGEQFFSAENLNDSQKLFADTLVKKAYDNWMHVIEYDGRALLNFTKGKKASISQKEVPLGSTQYLASYDQQASQMQFQASVPLEQAPVDTRAVPGVVSHSSSGGPVSAGYSGNQVVGYSSHPQSAVSSHIGYENTSYSHQNHYISSTHQNQISENGSISPALVPLHQANNDFHQLSQSIQHSNLSSSNAWPDQHEGNGTDEFLTEDEIRLRSHQMLENEDMQHLLRVFSMGGASSSFPEEGYGFPSYMPSPCPNFNFDDDRSRPSGKAVVGWLKIKAAMRWGIFIRKKAAEKRAAQLVELDE